MRHIHRQADSRPPIENIMRRSPYVKQCLMRVRKPTPHGSTGSRVNNIGSIILVPSLLISTMEAYFQGKKELFDGLAVASLEKNWIEYPVLHLDFSGRAYNEMDVVAKTLDDALRKWEKEYGSENRSDIPGIRFGNVIEAAYRRSGRQVVILVDEAESIKKLAEANGLSEDECRQKLAMMYIILELMGEYVEVERATSNGRTSALPQPRLPLHPPLQ